MASKRKATKEISDRACKIPAHITPSKDPQSSWIQGVESDPSSNSLDHERSLQNTKATEEITQQTSGARQDLTYSDYTVGWICALPDPELVAARAMLDEEYPSLPAADGDTNVYFLGKVGPHNVVIACLPDGSTGKSSGATVAKDMLRSFQEIRFGVLVGVGGGAPYLGTSDGRKAAVEDSEEEDSEEEDDESEDIKDIRLGDVVISLHSKSSEAVVQYDFGKSVQGGKFHRTGSLNKPPGILRSAVGALKARHASDGHRLADHLSKIFANPRLATKYQYQGVSKDRLFKTDIVHQEERKKRTDISPVLHYGTIGSADQVMKDSALRDEWARKEHIICFEMEAAGLMDSFPCLAIRGICDYADSHKNNKWQPYAAATAAAYAKELLNEIPATSVKRMSTINKEMEKLTAGLAANTATTQRVEEHVLTAEETHILHWLSSFKFSHLQNSAQNSRTLGTGEWLPRTIEYSNWRDQSAGLLWLYGVSGCGKSILCSTAIDDLKQFCKLKPRKQIGYWYFQFSDTMTQSVCNMLRSLLRQLSSSPLDPSIRSLWNQHQHHGSEPSTKELLETMWKLINSQDQEVFIVIDALDECLLPERRELLQVIQKLLDENNRKVHILATSRPEPDISAELKGLSTAIDIECLIKNDIVLFVQTELLQNNNLSRCDEDLKVQIEKKLTAVDETRFRWADLQIKRLQSCLNESELLDALNTIPESLEKTYQEALERIPTKQQQRVRNILIWLTSSLRPMAIEEIATVASIDDPERVLEVCTSLLVTSIDEQTKKTIRLAHFSVKEYLILKSQESESLSPYRFTNEEAHTFISKTAVTFFLNSGNGNIYNGKGIPSSLLKYYAEFWPRHAIKVLDSDYHDTKELQDQIDLLFNPDHSQEYITWLQIFDHDRESWSRVKSTEYPQPLYYAALLGFQMTVEMLLRKGCQIEMYEGERGNALNAAAIEGHFRIVKCLGEYHGRFWRMANMRRIVGVIRRNIENTLTLFLSKELEVEVNITEEVVKAAAGNYDGKEVMMILLEKRGADVVITEEVVKAAAGNYNGKEVMMILLEKRGADVVITEEVVKTIAGRFGKEVMMLLLEKRGADVVITEDVVKSAAGNRYNGKEVMMLLLEKRGADVVITEEVVKAAAGNYNGKEVMMILLEKRGADVVITEEVVKAAAGNYNGKEVMMILLEKRGADVVITEEVVKAAAGSYNGKEVMMLLLEKRGAGVVITEEVVKTIAGRFGKEVMMLLLEK